MPQQSAHRSRADDAPAHAEPGHGHGPYLRLALSLAISYVVMFAAMFARVDVVENVRLSLNNVYMAGLMVSPMTLVMLGTMPKMFGDRKLNLVVALSAAALTVLFFALIRTQAGIDDRQFLRSMIPHHAGAILVCERASLADGETMRLCRQIIESQRREIAEMNAMLAR